jgi:hypothetical protein
MDSLRYPYEMSLTFFDHRNRKVRQTSGEKASIPLGFHFTDCDSRRISDSCYDLLFTIDTRLAFPRIRGASNSLSDSRARIFVSRLPYIGGVSC